MSENDELEQLEYAQKFTSAQTNTVVEPFPGATYANARFVIDYLEYSGDAAGSLQIVDDTNTVVAGYFWAISAGGHIKLERPLKKIPKGRGFRITTTGSGNHNVIIKYHLEQLAT